MDEQPDDAGTPGRAVWPWILVVATALPTLLAADVARRILAGELDATYGASDAAASLTQRWEWLQYNDSLESGAFASAVGLVVLAALVLTGRPRALVPSRPARWLAAAVGAVTALVGLGWLIGTLVYAARDVPEPDGSDGFYLPSPSYLIVAPPFGLGVLAVVLAVGATVVLLRAPAVAGAPATEEDALDAPDLDALDVPVPAPAEPVEVRAPDHGPLADRAVPGAADADRAVLPGLPGLPGLRGLREDELALYRRPRGAPAAER